MRFLMAAASDSSTFPRWLRDNVMLLRMMVMLENYVMLICQ